MPELWLRKIFPATVFVSTDLPDKRLIVTNSQQDLEELDDESTDIFKSNITERYTIRPLNIPAVDDLCLAEFLHIITKSIEKKTVKQLMFNHKF